MTTYTIQTAQESASVGPYDPRKHLPYPFHIEADGSVLHRDFWRGDPAALIGFQATDEHRIDLWREEWIYDPQAAIGMFPVFVTTEGGLYTYMLPVNEVTVRED